MKIINDIYKYLQYDKLDPRRFLVTEDLLYNLQKDSKLKKYEIYIRNSEKDTIGSLLRDIAYNDSSFLATVDRPLLNTVLDLLEEFRELIVKDYYNKLQKDSSVATLLIDKTLDDTLKMLKSDDAKFAKKMNTLIKLFTSRFKDKMTYNQLQKFRFLLTATIDKYNDVYDLSNFISRNYSNILVCDSRITDWRGKWEKDKLLVLYDYTKRYYTTDVINDISDIIENLKMLNVDESRKSLLIEEVNSWMYDVVNPKDVYVPILNYLKYKEDYDDAFLILDSVKDLLSCYKWCGTILESVNKMR